MVFQEGSDLPVGVTPQESVATKFSHQEELQLKDNTKAEFFGNIKGAGVNISVVKGKKVGKIQETACKKQRSVNKDNNEGKGEIMYGQAKGNYEGITGVRIYGHI